MTIRTSNNAVSFARPFLLKGVDRVLPAGEYRVVADEDLIEQLSFPRLSARGYHDLRASGFSKCALSRDGEH
jgi:hypothetical protein